MKTEQKYLRSQVSTFEGLANALSNYSEAFVETANGQRWEEMIVKLTGFLSLKDDWDGEGSEAPGQSLVEVSILFARHLQMERITPPVHVYASDCGTIEFLWRLHDCYCEIELTPEKLAECRIVKGNTTEEIVFAFEDCLQLV